MKKLLIIFLISFSFANINSILYKIAIKNDLSNKTKKENSGILYVLTREDINSLQITHLRDILKILPIGYKFNRFGIIDPFNPNTNIPFLSSYIKVFIDNQEIISGFYNSGLPILNDIDIGWVDHVEVYTQAPSLDISTEPSIVIIKLYSKKASRDEGSNLHLSKGNKNSYFYFEQAKYLKYPYYTYISNNNDKSSYNNSFYDKQYLLNIYNENSSFLLYALASKGDGLFGFSMDGDVDNSYIKNKYFHAGYNLKFNSFKFYTALSLMKNKTYYYENPLLFIYNNIPVNKVNVKSFDRVFDLNLKYKKEIKKNIFLVGIKNRFKYFNWDKLRFNNFDLPQTSRDTQNVYTGFFQYSRFLKANSLLNFGYAFSFFQNSANFPNQKTKQYRIAHTFIKGKMVYKTVFSHIEYTIDPYLINSIFLAKKILKPTHINNIFESIKYDNFFHKINFSMGYFISKYYFFPNNKGLLDNSQNRIKEIYFSFRYNDMYSPFSKFSFRYFFHYLKNVPKWGIYRVHKIVFFNYNNRDNKHFFEELVVSKNENDRFYYNFSMGAKYFVNDKLDFFVKGENLLNEGEKYKFFSFNPLTQKFNSPIKVPFIERKITAGMEYSF